MKTIKEEWDKFAKGIDPGKNDVELVFYNYFMKGIKLAFYSGASVGVLKFGEIVLLDSDVRQLALAKILEECQEFCQQTAKELK